MRFLVALAAALLSVVAHAQSFPHAGVFPGKLPADLVGPPTPPTPSLESPWSQSVVGSGTGGSATSSSGTLTDACKGSMGFTADSGNLVYQSLSGDQEMIGRLDSIFGDSVWSRYAPMVRQSTAAGSKYAALFFDHRSIFNFNWRLTLDAHNDYVGFDTGYTAPQWWRITRTGSSFAGYVGPTSTGPWTLNGSQSVTMSDPVLWGVMCENGADANPAVETSLLPTISSAGGGGAGTLQLTESSHSINENGGTYTFSVSRVGGTTGAVGATLSRDGTSTATSGTDYTASPTLPATLSWSNGDGANKSVTVTVINRSGSQASRHLDVSLGSATGGATIGSPSASILTINDVSAGGATKWNPGYYTDCYTWMPHGGDFNHFIGSDGYDAFRACVDWSATQPPVKGVFIPLFWASLEGDTAGSYDGTVGNGLASAGKIGFPLVDDMLNYAASKGMHVIFELDWFDYYNDADCSSTQTDNSPNASYHIRGLLPKYLLSPSCGGTDASNTYSGGYQPWPDANTFYTKLWKPNVMTRWIALLNAYAVRYDNNPTLEKWVMFGEEGDASITPQDGSIDGYTFAALDGQLQRIVSEVKPNWPHTDIAIAGAWMRGMQATLAEAATSTTKTIGTFSNNSFSDTTTYGECAYLGLIAGCPNTGTHSYQGEMPFTLWLAAAGEICSALAYHGYHTPEEYHSIFMTTGKPDAGARALKPSHWVLAVYKAGLAQCPDEPTQNWGTIGGTGWYHMIQTHPLNSNCPSQFAGGCTP